MLIFFLTFEIASLLCAYFRRYSYGISVILMKNTMIDRLVVRRSGVLSLIMRCILGIKNTPRIINVVLDILGKGSYPGSVEEERVPSCKQMPFLWEE